jgi:hypothetical protein
MEDTILEEAEIQALGCALHTPRISMMEVASVKAGVGTLVGGKEVGVTVGGTAVGVAVERTGVGTAAGSTHPIKINITTFSLIH